MSGSPDRRRVWLVLGTVLAGGALVFWWLGSGGSAGSEEVVEDVEFGVGEIPEGPGRRGGVDDEERAGRMPDMGPGAPERPEQVSGLEVYLRESVYPPGSRPLTHESHGDLIDWNRRAEYARRTDGDAQTTFLYSADRYYVIGHDQPITSQLDVKKNGTPVRARITRATAQVRADRGPPLALEPPIVELDYEWNGNRHEHVLDPRVFGTIDRTVRIRMDIEFTFEGATTPQTDHINFTYTPQAAQPARFTGRFREEVENGTLMIYAGVEVFRGGWYNVDCNLWDANEEPVAWTHFKGELTTESTEVPLEFFGKVLRDSQTTPPWHIGELRGARFLEDTSPGEQLMMPFEGTYTTRSYDMDVFSETPYEDPRRDLIVEALREEAASGMGVSTPAASFETATEPALRQQLPGQ